MPACAGDSGDSGDGGAASSEASSAGTETEDVDADQVLEDATDATLASSKFGIEAAASFRSEPGEQTLELTAEGSVDYDATVADVRFGLDQQGQTQSIEILADGETAWVSSQGGAAPTFPGGATYVAGDAATLADASSFTPESLLGVVFVLRAGDEAEAGDPEEVDGVEASTYSFTVPYDEAVEAAGDGAEAFQSALSLTGAAAQADLVVEVAVGPDDVVRRLDLTIEGGDVPVGGGYELSLSDVGADVEAPEPPAEDDVATGPEAEADLRAAAQLSTSSSPRTGDGHGCQASGRTGRDISAGRVADAGVNDGGLSRQAAVGAAQSRWWQG